MTTNQNTLNKLSNMILEFELDELFLSAEMEQHLAADTLKLGRSEYVERRQYGRKLQEELDRSRDLVLAALDEWNEKCIRFFHPPKDRRTP